MRSEYSWHTYDGTTATTRETSPGHATGTVTTTVEDVRKLSSTTFAAFTTAWATEGYVAVTVSDRNINEVEEHPWVYSRTVAFVYQLKPSVS